MKQCKTRKTGLWISFSHSICNAIAPEETSDQLPESSLNQGYTDRPMIKYMRYNIVYYMPLYQIEVKILHIPLLHKQRANEKQN